MKDCFEGGGELIIQNQWRIFKGCLEPISLLGHGWSWGLAKWVELGDRNGKWTMWMGS